MYVSSICGARRERSKRGTHKSFAPEFLIRSAFKFPSYGLVVFIDLNTYLPTEGWNFKTLLKEFC